MLLVTVIRLSEDRDRMGAGASHETKCSEDCKIILLSSPRDFLNSLEVK